MNHKTRELQQLIESCGQAIEWAANMELAARIKYLLKAVDQIDEATGRIIPGQVSDLTIEVMAETMTGTPGPYTELKRIREKLQIEIKRLHEAIVGTVISGKKDNTKKNQYALNLDKRMRADLKKLKLRKLILWDGKGKPNFKSRLFLVCLVEYWRTIYDVPELRNSKIKYPIVNDNFLVNGNNPNVKTGYMNGKEYLVHKDDTLEEIKKILQ